MRDSRLTLLLVLALVLPLAVVAGGKDAAGAQAPGSILVYVVTELFEPVVNATVTVFETQENNTTDTSGRALFDPVEEGTYTIFATKQGYFASARTVEVQAGHETQVVFLLEAFPPPPEPRLEEHYFEGMYNCGIGFERIESADQCAFLPLEPPVRSRHNFTLDRAVTAAVMVARWGDAKVTNLGGTLSVTWTSPAGWLPDQIEGPSPLHHQWAFTANDTFTQTTTEAAIEVRPASGDASDQWQGASLVVVRQAYEVCVGIFYADFSVPDGYDPCPDA